MANKNYYPESTPNDKGRGYQEHHERQAVAPGLLVAGAAALAYTTYIVTQPEAPQPPRQASPKGNPLDPALSLVAVLVLRVLMRR